MFSNTISQLFEQHGYLIFYLAFSLGPFGIPVPNEITILTGGVLSNTGALDPWTTYICILSGLLTAITLSYCAGRIFGEKLIKRFQHKRHFQRAEEILKQRGDWAMCIGVFIPVVRYILPLFIGLSGVKFRKFALLSYLSVLFWTITFFTVGKYFGTHLIDSLRTFSF
ncbi:membrane protein DedA, SNARE-associated domain [Paenibacillus algorifonticola]|uniref:Membrane protein DedA, SNARE-associated domain n=1 Tax=Paenibacillus algorifonticola TaxID=684063 RepID=A0A1I2FW41_9BACL|nr:DedA family protein [Paenibacillus algorifonticola]SFF08997.1 membrane protein DedA, SNARE-associated domain [Paenibacillus algorifonticola]